MLFFPAADTWQDFAPAFLASFCFGMTATLVGALVYISVLQNVLRPYLKRERESLAAQDERQNG